MPRRNDRVIARGFLVGSARKLRRSQIGSGIVRIAELAPRDHMQFVIIERFRHGDPVPVYRRFRDRGRLAPDGLPHVVSWVTAPPSNESEPLTK